MGDLLAHRTPNTWYVPVNERKGMCWPNHFTSPSGLAARSLGLALVSPPRRLHSATMILSLPHSLGFKPQIFAGLMA